MKLTWGGLGVAVGGLFLVNVLGISDACSNEVSGKLVEYVPVAIGAFMSMVGGHKMAGREWYGGRKKFD